MATTASPLATPPSATRRPDPYSVALGLIVCLAIVVRFRHLDSLSLWFDEAIVPVMAAKPFDYLMRWVATLEIHPPLYHVCIRAIQAASQSDFALRLPSAVLGVVGIWLTYRVGTVWISRQAGLFAAVFLAFSPAHVYVSRVVRPYALALVFLSVCLLVLHRFLERKDDQSLYRLAALQGLMLATVYTALIPIMLFQTAAALVLLRSRPLGRALKALALNALLTFGPAAYFLVSCTYYRRGSALSLSLPDALANFGRAAAGTLMAQNIPLARYAMFPWSFWVSLAVALWGLVFLFRAHRLAFRLCAAFFLCTLVFVLVVRSSFSFTYWHLFSLYPFLALLAGAGICALLPRPFLAPYAAAALALAWTPYFFSAQGWLYREDASAATLRHVAKTLVSEVAPGQAVVLDTSIVDLVNRYVDQMCLVNSQKEQRFRADGSPVAVSVYDLPDGELKAGLMRPGPYGEGGAARLVSSSPLGQGAREVWAVDNPGEMPLPGTGELLLTAVPRAFYGQVAEVDRVMVYPYWSRRIIPTVNDAWTSFSYRFRNTAPVDDLLVRLTPYFRNIGTGNAFVVSCRFDDEPEQRVFASLTPEPLTDGGPDDGYSRGDIAVRRKRPFTMLTVTFSLYCAQVTPRYPTSNLDTVGLRSLGVTSRNVHGDLMRPDDADPEYVASGLHGVERGQDRAWRWGLGEKTVVTFPLAGAQKVRLRYGFINHMDDQSCDVVVNGVAVRRLGGIKRSSWTAEPTGDVVEFDGRAGTNTVEFVFSKINHVNASMSETDATPYTVAFTRLEFEPRGAGTVAGQ